jgi:lysozyme|tara:strand:- start:1156 stop:1737 length:582 start_codon:yes stop_codon:yes gene_type:complete
MECILQRVWKAIYKDKYIWIILIIILLILAVDWTKKETQFMIGNKEMYIDVLRKELARDEGVVYEIYLDHLGHPTFGIGHLISPSDPEFDCPSGTPVCEARVIAAFEEDIKTVLSDCEKLYPDFNDLPEEVQLIIANMMFNLGYTRLSKFRNMKSGVDVRDWNAAADEMVDSLWYRQVTNRANRLVERMRNIS